MNNLMSHSLLAEQSVIGCALFEPAVIPDLLKFIENNDFYEGYLKSVFSSLRQMTEQKLAIDLVLLDEYMYQNDTATEGNFIRLAEILKNTSSATNYQAYAKNIVIHSITRHRARLCADLAETSDPEHVNSLIDKIKKLEKRILCGEDIFDKLKFGSEGFDSTQEWEMDHFIPKESMGIIFGTGGSLKTFVAIHLACCLACEKPWDGRKVKKGGVIYFCSEGQSTIAKRFRAWELEHHLDVTLVARYDAPINLSSPASVVEILNICESFKLNTGCHVSLVIFDTFAMCAGSLIENDAGDIAAFAQTCRRITYETGASTLAIHHTGKDPSLGPRGSSSFKNNFDYLYWIIKSDDLSITLKSYKTKDFEVESRDYSLKEIELGFRDEFDNPVTSLVIDDKSGSTSAFGTGLEGELNKDVIKLVKYVQAYIKDDPDQGLNHKFLMEEVLSWRPKEQDKKSKQKFWQRLIAICTDKKYLRKSGDCFYLTVSTIEIT